MLELLGTIGGVVGLNPLGKAAKIVGGLFAAFALVGTFLAAKALYDHRVISNHDAKQVAATAKADRKADAKAADERRVDDSRLGAEATALEQVEVSHATDDARTRRIARQQCLRAQQAARASGSQPPACR